MDAERLGDAEREEECVPDFDRPMLAEEDGLLVGEGDGKGVEVEHLLANKERVARAEAVEEGESLGEGVGEWVAIAGVAVEEREGVGEKVAARETEA